MKYLSIVLAFCLMLSVPSLGVEKQAKHHKKHHVKHSYGLKRDAKKFKEFKKRTRHKRAFHAGYGTLPSHADNCAFVHIADQGSCGSCHLFSLTNTLRSTIASVGNPDPGELGWNYICGCFACCGGGDFPEAAGFVSEQQKGVWLNSDFPYTARDVSCKSFPIVAHATAYHMLGDGNNPPSFADIAYEIGVEHKTVSVDVSAGGGWESGTSSEDKIFDGSGGWGINHMIGICAYDTEGGQFDGNGNLPKGVGWVKVFNSWGTSWAVNGFMKQRLIDKNGHRVAQLASDALVFDVETPPTPTPTPVPVPGVPNWVWFAIIAAIILGSVIIVIFIRKTEEID